MINIILIFFCATSFSADRYVVEPGTIADGNGGIYSSWDIAATQIQWAVSAAAAGETVWVSNGTYLLTNQITISAAITTRSVNGRSATIVDGNNYYGKLVTNRCFDMSGSAVLDGFTVRNGIATNLSGGGGGIRCNPGKIYNCRIENNASSNAAAGGIEAENSSTITNCQIISNRCVGSTGGGGTIRGGSVYGCEISGNTNSGNNGAGLLIRSGAIVSNCIFFDNANGTAGGGLAVYGDGSVYNSLFYRNRSPLGGGIHVDSVGAGNVPIVRSCTVVSNYASSQGGGIYISGVYPATSYVENIISYYNISAAGSNLYYSGTGYSAFVYSCIGPTSAIPTTNIIVNAGNIQSDPKFINWTNGNYRLRADSPCVNAGTNQTWMTNACDLDRAQRIRYGVVDMGAFERVNEGTIYTIH